MEPSVDKTLNKYSSQITQKKSQGASQAMLYATGLKEPDMGSPQVGIASVWFEGNPCNMHLLSLSEKVKQGVQAAGLVGLRFNTIGVSDGISMGTDGMSFSLQSRDLIADSIETVMAAQWYDANISIPGCDKNMPGCVIAMGRLNRPSLMIYGGTIRAGHLNGEKLDIISAFQSYGQFISHSISDQQRQAVVRNACPGAGACGGMYTANTMASAIEALGMTLPYSSSTPAEDPGKIDECLKAGAAIRVLLERDIKPRDIMTRAAFERRFCSSALPFAASASPPAPPPPTVLLHIPNTAKLSCPRACPVSFFFLPPFFFLAGFRRAPLRRRRRPWQQLVSPTAGCSVTPLKQTSHLQILRGNLAPDGAVAKITGKEGLRFSGPARSIFDSEELMLTALEEGKIHKGDVVVIRYEGPKGGPGMPEMLTPTSAIVEAGSGKMWRL